MENFHHKFANLVPPPTDGTKKCLLRCKAHPDSNSRRKWRPNPCIIGDAILSQTGKKNWPKMRSGNLRLAVAPSDAGEKNCNIGWYTATIPHVHNIPKEVLENLLPADVWLLVRTNLFIPSPFWTTTINFDNCCLHYVATCGKRYIGAHLYSRP